MISRICVFCGSSSGQSAQYARAATEFGAELVRRRIGLVYGGGSVGLMGTLADAVLDGGGEVIGVIPMALATKELLHPRVRDMRRVRDMHERKAQMAQCADAFVALPGGLGTFEELFEVITWAQLGFHRKNIGLLNVGGYFDPLIELFEHGIREGFIREAHRKLIVVEDQPAALCERLQTHELPAVRRWLGPESI